MKKSPKHGQKKAPEPNPTARSMSEQKHHIGHQAPSIDFAAIKTRADPFIVEILEELSPDGELRGSEYFMYNPHRDDGELGSFKYNIDNNKYGDFVDDEVRGYDIIALAAFLLGVTQSAAAQKILEIVERLESEGNAVPEAGPATSKARPKRKRKPSKPASTAIVPIPGDAPAPPSEHPIQGKPSACYHYHDASGQTACLIYRFDPPGQDKTIRPLTYRRDEVGKYLWDWLGLDGARPLYNLYELVQRPDAPVLVVEGEKSADAARSLFPDRVVVTTAGGSGAAEKSDLSPLKGRSILIWPDNDGPGQKYLNSLVKLLRLQDPAAEISVLAIPDVSPEVVEGKATLKQGYIAPEGWDAADAVNEGWTAEHVSMLDSSYFHVVGEVDSGLIDELDPYSGLALPDRLRNLLLDQFPGGLVYANEDFLGYQDGYWRRLEERAEVRNAIARHLGENISEPKNITDPLNILKDILARTDDGSQPDRNYLCLKNGTLNTTTFELEAHSAIHNLRTQIPVSWNPEATCDRWMQFLDEVFANDADKSAKIQFLQEWFGYCLTPDASQHKFVWMVGAGGNGKSVLLNILTHLVGPENVSHAHLERLDRPAVRAELEGKLVNLSSEMSAEATMADSYFKAIVSGDIVEAERKYKPSYSFRPFVRLIGATNHLPRLLDISEGFFRRAIVLTFTRQFSEAEQDKDLENKLVAELDGIFVWAVAGLARLRQHQKFVIPPSSVAELSLYREESDPIGMFAEACLVADETQSMKAIDMFKAYLAWCKDMNFKPKNASGFGRRLGELGYKKYRTAEGTSWYVKERPGNEYFNAIGYLEFTLHDIPFDQDVQPSAPPLIGPVNAGRVGNL